MSRAYRIRISESLRRHIQVDDGIQSKLEILDILAPEQTAALLERELAAAGFEQDEQGVWVRVDEDGVAVRVDAKTSTVTVTAAADADVELERERVVTAWAENDEASRARGKAALSKELEGEVAAQEKQLQAEVTEALEGKLGDLRKELDQISNRVTAEALKQKAASMGEIQEISEDLETGSLTIRVKV
jgi:ethanolamine utilization cobalamin adenosyltransferase